MSSSPIPVTELLLVYVHLFVALTQHTILHSLVPLLLHRSAHSVAEGRAHQRALHHWPRFGCQEARWESWSKFARVFYPPILCFCRSPSIFYPTLFWHLIVQSLLVTVRLLGSTLSPFLTFLSTRLELFADSCGIAHLRQCFAELKELVRASLHPDLQQMADNANLRKSLFPRLDPLRLASLLEKVHYFPFPLYPLTPQILSFCHLLVPAILPHQLFLSLKYYLPCYFSQKSFCYTIPCWICEPHPLNRNVLYWSGWICICFFAVNILTN